MNRLLRRKTIRLLRVEEQSFNSAGKGPVSGHPDFFGDSGVEAGVVELGLCGVGAAEKDAEPYGDLFQFLAFFAWRCGCGACGGSSSSGVGGGGLGEGETGTVFLRAGGGSSGSLERDEWCCHFG